ncbi:MAG: hypothetical protein HN348_17225 [Proteobacteria bacterium]|jgi:hypothetical protein|nr:hypothetical protein [Pseudomonadota bacterium]
MTDADLELALTTLGELLDDRGERFDLVVIGGGALLLLGLIDRPTKDLDVVARIDADEWTGARPFPDVLRDAVSDVAAALDLAEDWLNPGPADIMQFGLPNGFEERVTVRNYGSLTVQFAAREDQVAFKLDAAADWWPEINKHFKDLEHLLVQNDELMAARRWCRAHRHRDRFQQLDEVITSLLLGDFNE